MNKLQIPIFFWSFEFWIFPQRMPLADTFGRLFQNFEISVIKNIQYQIHTIHVIKRF
jgi:hypothetical protein